MRKHLCIDSSLCGPASTYALHSHRLQLVGIRVWRFLELVSLHGVDRSCPIGYVIVGSSVSRLAGMTTKLGHAATLRSNRLSIVLRYEGA